MKLPSVCAPARIPPRCPLTALLLAAFVVFQAAGEHAVLLTGFEPWGHFAVNPSGLVADMLDGLTVLDRMIVAHRLAVNESGEQETQRLVQVGGWDAVIHLGLENETKGLKVEVAAKNYSPATKKPIDLSGPHILPTTCEPWFGRVAAAARACSGDLEP